MQSLCFCRTFKNVFNRAPLLGTTGERAHNSKGSPWPRSAENGHKSTMLMLQLRCPTRTWCIFLKVISHRSILRLDCFCDSLTCFKYLFLQTTITGASGLMQRQSCRVIQRDSPALASPLQLRRWMQPSICKQPEKHWFLWKGSITG